MTQNPKARAEAGFILTDAEGNEVQLPFLTSYMRDDNGLRWPARIIGISIPPKPDASLLLNRRGRVEVQYARDAKGTRWGAPYYGCDPADFNLQIKQEAKP